MPSSKKVLKEENDELRREANELQLQIDSLTKLQNEMAGCLRVLSRNYRIIVDEFFSVRKSMVNQQNIIQNISRQLPQLDTSNGGNNYG